MSTTQPCFGNNPTKPSRASPFFSAKGSRLNVDGMDPLLQRFAEIVDELKRKTSVRTSRAGKGGAARQPSPVRKSDTQGWFVSPQKTPQKCRFF